jgi:hypothetical protein
LAFPSPPSAPLKIARPHHHGVLINSRTTTTLYAVHDSPFVHDPPFVNTNAMEKSRSNGPAIQEHRHGHRTQGTRYDTMITMVDPWEPWQIKGARVVDELREQEGEPRQSPLSTSRQQRVHTRVRRPQMASFNTFTFGYLLFLLASLWIVPATAVEIEFENCLSSEVQTNAANGGLQLQFIPLFFDAVFNPSKSLRTLDLRVWGNVTGSGPEVRQSPLPDANSSYWESNSTDSGGKIIDVPSPETNNKHTTLASSVDVLTYQAAQDFSIFCDGITNGSCPLGPNFNANA